MSELNRVVAVVARGVIVALVASACSGGSSTLNVATASSAPATSGVAAAVAVPSSTSATTTTTTTSTTVATTTTEPQPFRWNLMAGGDVLMDRSEAAGIDPFAKITPSLASATISMVNIEMSISDRGTAIPGKQFTFRAPPSAADTIAAAGVDVVTLGNNHARDYGSTALTDTLDLFAERDVVTIGAGTSDTEAFTPRVIRLDGGLDVAFIGAALIVPGGFAATSSRAGVADGNDRNRVIANVRVASERYDVVIVTLHWGTERATCPSATHRTFTEQLFDAGATAVIGHHPHVLQPIEFEDGKVAVFSLGNFVWHPRTTITADTGVVELMFEEDVLIDVVFHPHSLDDFGAPAPVSEGFRFERIVDIVGGECAKHQPPPLPPTTTTVVTVPTGSTTTTTGALETTTTTSVTTTTATTTTTTAPTETSGG